MKTILVDDELLAMEQFEQECQGLPDIELVGKFDNAEDALDYAKYHRVEFALLDICLPGMDGIELGRALKQMNPDMILVFVTGHTRYVVDTLKIKADYCIMKPYDKEDIEDVLKRVKLLSKRFQKRVRVVTFGKFEVYIDDKPVYFANGKAKELFAYCISRQGATVTMEEAIDVLWPDRPYDEKVKRLYRKAISAIQTALEDRQTENIFVSKRGCCHIAKEHLDCDYFRLLEGSIPVYQMQNMLKAGFLTDYSWAEYCNARLADLWGEKN